MHIVFVISISYIHLFARFTVDKDEGAEGCGV